MKVVYGQAAGHLVALIEDASGLEGLVLKIVIGRAAGNSIEAVAFFVAANEGRIECRGHRGHAVEWPRLVGAGERGSAGPVRALRRLACAG